MLTHCQRIVISGGGGITRRSSSQQPEELGRLQKKQPGRRLAQRWDLRTTVLHHHHQPWLISQRQRQRSGWMGTDWLSVESVHRRRSFVGTGTTFACGQTKSNVTTKNMITISYCQQERCRRRCHQESNPIVIYRHRCELVKQPIHYHFQRRSFIMRGWLTSLPFCYRSTTPGSLGHTGTHSLCTPKSRAVIR